MLQYNSLERLKDVIQSENAMEQSAEPIVYMRPQGALLLAYTLPVPIANFSVSSAKFPVNFAGN